MQLEKYIFLSVAEYRDWCASNRDKLVFRRRIEEDLEKRLTEEKHLSCMVEGYCVNCQEHQHFSYDLMYGDGANVNWRERLVCKKCGLNNRQRLVLSACLDAGISSDDRVYLTEQTSQLANVFSIKYSNVILSEFVGDDVPPGCVDDDGVRHEDLRHLSFDSASMDAVLSFDVLEHIADYKRALTEIRRVLKFDGKLILTAPFNMESIQNITRAEIGPDGVVRHLMQPEYHGDPLNPDSGILCYRHFGWELLNDLREVGFANVVVDLFWSSDFSNLGDGMVVIYAGT